MKLHFLGTRGNIRIRSKLHFNHAALLIEHNKKQIMIDCGNDYINRIKKINPDALLITHAHDDHVGGLKNGIECPVYATQDTWNVINNYPIKQKITIQPESSFTIAQLEITAYSVMHAINAPAVGYRISDGNISIFYVPDLVNIENQKKALKNVAMYIGDGAIVTRTLLIRKRDDQYIGHTPIIKQIEWCKKEKVPCMIVTHCGTEIVSRDGKTENMQDILANMGKKNNVHVVLAYDGMDLEL